MGCRSGITPEIFLVVGADGYECVHGVNSQANLLEKKKRLEIVGEQT